jgi:hypothetical protein
MQGVVMRSFYKQVFGWILISAMGPFFLFVATLMALSEFAPAQQAPVQQTGAEHTGANLAATPPARVSQVTVTPDGSGIDVEITTTRSVPMRSQVVTGPDRLILDFPDSLPGHDLHDQSINSGQVKGLRVGLFVHNPPVTRVVIDLKNAQPYRIYPSGKTVIVKLLTGDKQVAAGAAGTRIQDPRRTDANSTDARINPVSYTPPVPAKPAPALNVQFQNGRMSILAHDVSLAQVLSEVQHKTGADIPIPSAAAQEQVVADIGLSPVRDALTALLNGSRFNFVMVGADNDPSKLKSLILTFRGGGASQPAIAPPAPEPAVVDTRPDPEPPQPEMEAQPDPRSPPEAQPQPEPQPQEGQGQQEAPAPPDAPQADAPPPNRLELSWTLGKTLGNRIKG